MRAVGDTSGYRAKCHLSKESFLLSMVLCRLKTAFPDFTSVAFINSQVLSSVLEKN